MAVTTGWTSPITGGAIDLNAGDQLTAVVWDKVLSNLYALAGSAGPGRQYNSSQGALPASGFPVVGNCMGALANDWHIEYGSQAIGGNASAAITFTNAFGSSGYYLAYMPSGAQRVYYSALAASGCTLNNGDGTSTTVKWIAVGPD
jgi:hypothetical protein